MTKPRRVIKVNAMSYGILVRHMLEGVYTLTELAEHTGLHYLTVCQYARALHHAGAAHITSWEKDARGRDVIKVYKIGHGVDTARERFTNAQRQARLRAKRAAHQHAQVMGGTARYVQAANGRLRFEFLPA